MVIDQIQNLTDCSYRTERIRSMGERLSPPALSNAQRETLIELGSRGSGGSFDQQALSDLFVMELVEVRSTDRRVILTERGRELFAALPAKRQRK